MICYLSDITEDELSVINDYWELSEDLDNESFDIFQYTLDQITNKHQSKRVRSVSFLAKKSVFFVLHDIFICQDCNCKIPAKNRMDFVNRLKTGEAAICDDCLKKRRQCLLDDARQVINTFKAEKFVPTAYLNSLSIEELLALLSITTEQARNNAFLGTSPDEVTITGVQLIDQRIVHSLVDKQALIYIPQIPSEVEMANNVIHGNCSHITYENRYKNPVQYRTSGSISSGVYLNHLDLGSGEEASDISQVLYQKLQSLILSVEDVTKVHQIVKEIQLGKLYNLIHDIAKEYKIAIDHSNVLRGLLDHLADNYAPMKIYFTFRVKARDTIEYMHKESISGYIAKHCFAKFVGNYIQYIEEKRFELKKAWTLPPHIQTSPFEAIFSQLYLADHFDWNKLSTKEIVSQWLENVHLAEEDQELLS